MRKFSKKRDARKMRIAIKSFEQTEYYVCICRVVDVSFSGTYIQWKTISKFLIYHISYRVPKTFRINRPCPCLNCETVTHG